MTKLIGIAGKMKCGKTTLADLIIGENPGAVRMSFADALRDEVADLLGVSPRTTRCTVFKELIFKIGNRELTGREILQWWGTEIRRAADPDYWVRRAEDAIRASSAPMIVFDDVRFVSEADMIERMGGMLIRLEPYAEWEPGPNAEHESEKALDGHPFVFRYAPCFGELGSLASLIAEAVK